MNTKDEYDWLSFLINFVLGAFLSFITVAAFVWRYSPNTQGNVVLLIAIVSSFFVGLVSGVWKTGFWFSISNVTKYSPYAKKKK